MTVPLRDALIIPQKATYEIQDKVYVFVVGKDNVVTAKPVQTGAPRGDLRVIRSGITKDDRVIIGGVQRAMPGQKVTPQPGKIQQGPAPAAPTGVLPAGAALPAGKR